MEINNYTPPTAEVVEVSSEGVFCISGEHGFEQWKEQDFVW